MNNLEKITKNKIFLIIIMFILIKPGIFSENISFHKIGLIIDFLRIIICLYVISTFFINKLKPNKSYLILLYYVIIFIPTYLYNGDFFSFFIQLLLSLMWVILFNYNIQYNNNNFLDALEMIFYLLITINAITIFLFPGGMYLNSSNYLANYFLGYDNNYIMYILPGLTISYLNSYRKYNKISKKTIVLFFISLFAVIKAWVATSIVILILLLVLVYYFNLDKKKKNYFIKIILLLFFVVIISLLLFTNTYEYIVVNILKKDVTLSSRTLIWEKYFNFIKLNPIIGHGYEPATKLLTKTGYLHAHNIYLHTLYQGGIILFAYFINLLIIFFPNNKSNKKIYNYLLSVFICFIILFFFKSDTAFQMFLLTLMLINVINEKKIKELS